MSWSERDGRVVKCLQGQESDDPGSATPHESRKRGVAGSIEPCDRVCDKKRNEACQARGLAQNGGGQDEYEGVSRGELNRVKGEETKKQNAVNQDRRGEEDGDCSDGGGVGEVSVGMEDDIRVEAGEVDGLAYSEEAC